MALSTCPRCEGHSFEVALNEPLGSNYKMVFIQCSGCGTPIGVMDYHSIGSLLKDQEQLIKAVLAYLDRIESVLSQIVQSLRR